MFKKIFCFEDIQKAGGISQVIKNNYYKSFEISSGVYEKIKWVCSGIGFFYDISKVEFKNKKIVEVFAIDFSNIRGLSFCDFFCKTEEKGVYRFFYIGRKKK